MTMTSQVLSVLLLVLLLFDCRYYRRDQIIGFVCRHVHA